MVKVMHMSYMSRMGYMSLAFVGMVLALSISAWAAPQAHAEVSIGVSPSLLELEAAPGNTGEQALTVSNTGDETFSATVSVKEYPRADEKISAEKWLEVAPEKIEIEPGEEQDVTVNMQVPSDAKTGGHYAIVAFRTGAREQPQTGTAVAGEIGVPLLFTIKGAGPLVREANVSRIVPRLLEDGTVGFQVIMKNNGNVHFFPEGELRIDDKNGKTIQTLEVPESTALIPGTERAIDVTGSLPLDPGEYTATATVDYEGKRPATGELTFSPTARLSIEELAAEKQPDKGPNLRLVLANDGELQIAPLVRLDIFASGGLVGSAAPGQPVEVTPGEREEINTEYPGQLGPGKYMVTATVLYGDGETLQEQTSFTLNEPAAAAQRPGAPEPPQGAPVTTPVTNWWMVAGLPLGIMALLVVAITWAPPFKPLRYRLRQAWSAFRGSE